MYFNVMCSKSNNDLCFSILQQYFGPVVAAVGANLKCGPKPLKCILSNLEFKRSSVVRALAIMIHYGFVTYKIPPSQGFCEYILHCENVLLVLHYPRYVAAIYKKYGIEAKLVVEQLILNKHLCLSSLILKVAVRLREGHPNYEPNLNKIKDVLRELVISNLIVRLPDIIRGAVPIFITADKKTSLSMMPDMDLNDLLLIFRGSTKKILADAGIYWMLNFDRLDAEIRDGMLIQAIENRFDKHAGLIMRHILKLSSFKSDMWKPDSDIVSLMHLKDAIYSDVDGSYAFKHVDVYLKAIETDSNRFICKSSEYNSSVYACMKRSIDTLTFITLCHIVEQNYGNKAARIFWLVYDKNYCEVEQIQQLAMLSDKEAKSLTYKLLEHNFLQLVDLKKPITITAGPTKAFYLFHVNIDLVVRMLLDICYKSVYNVMNRMLMEQQKYSHIYEKKMNYDMLGDELKQQGAPAQRISDLASELLNPSELAILKSVEKTVYKLSVAELQVVETIFLFQIYLRYNVKHAAHPK